MKKQNLFKNLPESPFFYLSLGVVLCVGLFTAFYTAMPHPEQVQSMVDRLSYTLQWHSLTALFIFYMVFRITLVRLAASSVHVQQKDMVEELEASLKLNYEILNSTFEQSFIFFIISLGATTVLPLEEYKIVPISIMLFFIGRSLYLMGYLKKPSYRTIGMPFSFLINGGMILIVLQHLMTMDIFTK